jgi:Ribonuclease G/E
MTTELEELKLGERKFLHDIANDIVVAQGMCTFVLRKVKENKPLEEKDLERLEKTLEAINKMTKKIKDRRAILIGNDSSSSGIIT